MKKKELKIKMASIYENCKKPIATFLGECNVATLSGWAIADLSLCDESTKTKKIKGKTVKYNLAEKHIFIENFRDLIANDVIHILNIIKSQEGKSS